MFHNQIFTDQQAFRHGHAFLVGHHGGYQIARAAVFIERVNVEANAGNHMTVQRVCFGNPDPAGSVLVDHGGQNLYRVLVGAVNADLPFARRRMIAVRRCDFPDGVGAIAQLAEGQIALRIGSLLLHQCTLRIENAEYSAG